MPIDLYLSLVLHVAVGVWSIQSPGVPVSAERAADYAVAATYHGERAGVDPFELVAIARNESDFAMHLRGPDGKDCGLTQTRITVSRYSCRQLLRSYWLDFKEAAREMSEYARACRGHGDYDRCRFNHYNSGARYARHGFHGAYYIRVTCFAEAARAGLRVDDHCRHARGRRDIARILRRAVPRAKPALMAASDVPAS
ncbi:MAG TPA: hypothetical protein VII38_12670 [Polyangia bacterium]|jgi:hypothetical protein